MSSDVDLRTTLRHAADRAEAPAIDEAGIDRRARRYRNRRRSRVAAATAAVAALALVGPVAVDRMGSDEGTAPVTGPAVEVPNPPAYFLAGRQVMALDPRGRAHELPLRGGDIVGPTKEGVLLWGPDGLRHVAVIRDGVGWIAKGLEPPPTGQIETAAVSADGTRLAVVDLDQNVVVYDLATGDEVRRISPAPPGESTFVLDFSERVLYAVGPDTLRLGVGDDAVELAGSVSASTGGDRVAVSDGGTVIYDVSDGTAREVAEVPGGGSPGGDLSPDGRYYLAAPEEGEAVLWEHGAGEPRPVTGLVGSATQIGWLDTDTALVVTDAFRAGKRVGLLFACEAATAQCEQVYNAGTKRVSLPDS